MLQKNEWLKICACENATEIRSHGQFCTVLHCIALYFTVLHCIVLYCTVLHCTVLYCSVCAFFCTLWTFSVLYGHFPAVLRVNLLQLYCISKTGWNLVNRSLKFGRSGHKLFDVDTIIQNVQTE